MNEIKTVLPLMSIVVPAKNEQDDIASTLEMILDLDYQNKEIIVVDDSNDYTPNIVKSFEGRGVKLIQREVNADGCCGARNLGMRMAQGEIIVIMNADVRPEKNFLNLILKHHQEGADYVVVSSKAMNVNNIWGKLVSAKENHHLQYLAGDEWSEGFSCNRKAAIDVGFIPGKFPVNFCRDVMFGANLNKAGYKKVVDSTIVMKHIVPEKFSDFWRERIWRGSFSALTYYYFKNKSVKIILIREILKAVRTTLKIILVFPKLVEAIKLSKFSTNKYNDIFTLYVASVVEEVALTVGNFKGFKMLVKTVKNQKI
jgi:glycosyltransferase involved in cell wall biosynthesis